MADRRITDSQGFVVKSKGYLHIVGTLPAMYAPTLLSVSPSVSAGVRARISHPAHPYVRRTAQAPLAPARRLI
ncbi:hypothetical protein [Burkholderia latens]|uniref:Uncharacterized protein n=1 Tax=Burkholderia latens TaxID=488446 RepID=A0A6H9TNP9_9BURK|nr:hypothetical protein [Burkholderia latens]KAB0641990.1 hypothetical protein F7R21_13840 [Burkholderia latens]